MADGRVRKEIIQHWTNGLQQWNVVPLTGQAAENLKQRIRYGDKGDWSKLPEAYRVLSILRDGRILNSRGTELTSIFD